VLTNGGEGEIRLGLGRRSGGLRGKMREREMEGRGFWSVEEKSPRVLNSGMVIVDGKVTTAHLLSFQQDF